MTSSFRILFSTWMAGAALATVCGAQFSLAEGAQEPEAATASVLTVIDPYLLKIPANGDLTAAAVVTAAAGDKAEAKGIVADGTSAAIAVFKASSSKSVTLSATNGGKVAAYAPHFLTAVGAMNNKVVVTPSKIGSSYYALALVTSGVAPDAENGVDTVVRAQSAGSTTITSYSLVTLPTPVVLVHGLWGDQTSLASTEAYLKANASFKSNPSLVTAICYSVYLGFDAASDTLPAHGKGCEITSAQALSQYLSTTLYKELDKNQWVGGRVDAVVHSMGGLAARHFTSTSGYRSARNRMLGAFRDVITLDTPEAGSALATYLDDTAYNRTLKDTNPASNAYQIWEFLCGSDPKTTVEACLGSDGFPLAYPGKALSTGAVASLIPGGKSIESAPAATAFNTRYGKWFAIASDWKPTDKSQSFIRAVLDDLIAATYATGQTAPTTSSILGSPDNDVIVTVASQTATAVPAQVKEFKDLAHTGIPGLSPEPPYSNASVTDSPAVNAQAAFWLGLQATATPAAAEWESVPQESEIGEGGPIGLSGQRRLFAASERLAVEAPQHAVGLGQPVEIPLAITGPKISRIEVEQFDGVSMRRLTNESTTEMVGSGKARILSETTGKTSIEVVPLGVGTVRLRATVFFADGGFAKREIELNVTPSQRRLESFQLNNGFDALALVLEDRDEDRQAFLAPVARYGTLKSPIYLDGSEQLNLTVDQPEDDPVIRVDANGLVHALRAGSAVITGDFDGIKDTIAVNVYSKEDAPAGYRRGAEN